MMASAITGVHLLHKAERMRQRTPPPGPQSPSPRWAGRQAGTPGAWRVGGRRPAWPTVLARTAPPSTCPAPAPWTGPVAIGSAPLGGCGRLHRALPGEAGGRGPRKGTPAPLGDGGGGTANLNVCSYSRAHRGRTCVHRRYLEWPEWLTVGAGSHRRGGPMTPLAWRTDAIRPILPHGPAMGRPWHRRAGPMTGAAWAKPLKSRHAPHPGPWACHGGSWGSHGRLWASGQRPRPRASRRRLASALRARPRARPGPSRSYSPLADAPSIWDRIAFRRPWPDL